MKVIVNSQWHWLNAIVDVIDFFVGVVDVVDQVIPASVDFRSFGKMLNDLASTLILHGSCFEINKKAP